VFHRLWETPVVTRRRLRLLVPLVGLLVVPSQGFSVLSYSVSPGEVAFIGAASTEITVKNVGNEVAPLLVSVADYRLTAAGETSIGALPPTRSARRWLFVAPPKLSLRPGESADIRVASAPPALATPGDHSALLLVGSDPKAGSGEVRVNTRIAVPVYIRVLGDIRRGLSVRRLVAVPVRPKKAPKIRTLRLTIENRGNIAEKLSRGRARLELRQGSRRVANLLTGVRTVLPGARADLDFRYQSTLKGVFTAIVRLTPVPAVRASGPRPTIVRRYRVRL
jgi:hypothetical protein